MTPPPTSPGRARTKSPTANPTIADLAHSLGLSKSAVSNALNDRPGVSESTRVRVKEAAAASGWRPNALARALSTGQAGAFGLCIARNPAVLRSESYYQRVIAGIEEVLIDTDHALLLRLVGESNRDLDVYRQWASEHRVDAVVLFDLRDRDPRPGLMTELGMPAVIQGVSDDTTHPVLNGDIAAEADLLVAHLHEQGCRRLVLLHGPTSFTHEIIRQASIHESAKARGIEVRTVESDYSQEDGHRVGQNLLDEGWADAVIASNDLLAVGVSRAQTEAGTRQLRIASWDDSPLCAYLHPGITALDRHPHALGRQVAELMLALVRGESPSLQTEPVTLVVRGSTPP